VQPAVNVNKVMFSNMLMSKHISIKLHIYKENARVFQRTCFKIQIRTRAPNLQIVGDVYYCGAITAPYHAGDTTASFQVHFFTTPIRLSPSRVMAQAFVARQDGFYLKITELHI